MMTRDKALAALDEAFKDKLSKLYDFFTGNEGMESADLAQTQFEAGFDNEVDAYNRAFGVIERKFPA